MVNLNNDLTSKRKEEAITLTKYNILKKTQIRKYNEGCRPDGLNFCKTFISVVKHLQAFQINTKQLSDLTLFYRSREYDKTY